MRLPALVAVSSLLAAAWLSGCASAPSGSRATAWVKAVYGQVPAGHVQFNQQGADTVVYVHFGNLPGNAQYAIHVHEKGVCNPPTLDTSGPIFDPTGTKPHGPLNREHKMGDLPNLVGNIEGLADDRYVLPGVKVSDLIGRSVIVHRNPDDYRTQPEGDSGDRIGCGVIEAG